MKPIHVSEDILTIAEFKTHVSKILRKTRSRGRPVVITQSGKPAAVLTSPEYFDRLSHRDRFLSAVKQGLGDFDSDRVLSDEQLKQELDKNFGTLE